ncbi:MAG: hypothetical protein ACOYXW_01730 [Actinomycetota bacterium]
MRIAVLGGTGTVGRHVVSAVREGGDEPVVIARSRGVDLTTGVGLAPALEGVETVVFVQQTLSRVRVGRAAVVPRMLVQPVAASVVGELLADTARAAPGGHLEVGGPEPRQLTDLARELLRRTGERRLLLTPRLPGRIGRAQSRGALLPGRQALLRGPTFEEWLAGTSRGSSGATT